MKTYQFTCAVRLQAPDTPWDGELMPIEGLVTPPIKADTPSEAMRSQEVSDYCTEHKCTVYEMVRSWSG
ncbi:hypothetical protein PAECIP111893_02380 [Paenibacillus plantiphilus]|uniref:Uncharacterized protein n=1 Tax=Paenibacillus plantiphilus TaxID=2905650 RepID=A0ABN8GKL2_9BACL|nr:hypothetical protein PAECIP111893_02380 [Paenibacillus plantiphilus]